LFIEVIQIEPFGFDVYQNFAPTELDCLAALEQSWVSISRCKKLQREIDL
jgi:hypothetical protein